MYKILSLSLLCGTVLIAPGMCQQAEDVGQLMYQVEAQLNTQEQVLRKTHAALLEAHQTYVSNPNQGTYGALLDAAKQDQVAASTYSELIKNQKVLNDKIIVAEKRFYEETPVTKDEMNEGTKMFPAESLANEKNMTEQAIESRLSSEVKQSGGRGSEFADQLKEQMKKLQSMKDRVDRESSSGKIDGVAKKQDDDLSAIISRAMDARRKAIADD